MPTPYIRHSRPRPECETGLVQDLCHAQQIVSNTAPEKAKRRGRVNRERSLAGRESDFLLPAKVQNPVWGSV